MWLSVSRKLFWSKFFCAMPRTVFFVQGAIGRRRPCSRRRQAGGRHGGRRWWRQRRALLLLVEAHPLQVMLLKSLRKQQRLCIKGEVQLRTGWYHGGRRRRRRRLQVVDGEVVGVGVGPRRALHGRRRQERHPGHGRHVRRGHHPLHVLVHPRREHHRRRRRHPAAHPHHLHRDTSHIEVSFLSNYEHLKRVVSTHLQLELQRLEVLDRLVQHRRLVRLKEEFDSTQERV